ncbi:MAG: DNA repair protein RadA [Deinococcota bacterium]
MSKVTTTYICDTCGTQAPMAMGRCPGCGAWGTMQAQVSAKAGKSTGRGARKSSLGASVLTDISTTRMADVPAVAVMRTPSGISEVDLVLGGGWVAGASLLIAGEPGIGKSTLLLQLAHEATLQGRDTLYVAGEESLEQISLRAERLGVSGNLTLTRETSAWQLAEYLRAHAPPLAIIDSIQTLTSDDDGIPGSLTQVRDSTALLSQAAKDTGTTLVLIGHITKQGNIAGPKVIEHIVDATLALEVASDYRVLRSLKNRFGAAGEVGVFEMTAQGMSAVGNPSLAFLAERPQGVPGSVVAASLEGQRPLFLEVQALAAKSPYSSPRRIVQGLEQRRVDVVLAVLERRINLPLEGLDVYVNVAGGLRLTDPGTDLAVATAVYSAVTNRPAPEGTAVVGEVGLAGELRSVPQLARRASEASRCGFDRVIGPGLTGKDLSSGRVTSLADALKVIWEV